MYVPGERGAPVLQGEVCVSEHVGPECTRGVCVCVCVCAHARTCVVSECMVREAMYLTA